MRLTEEKLTDTLACRSFHWFSGCGLSGRERMRVKCLFRCESWRHMRCFGHLPSPGNKTKGVFRVGNDRALENMNEMLKVRKVERVVCRKRIRKRKANKRKSCTRLTSLKTGGSGRCGNDAKRFSMARTRWTVSSYTLLVAQSKGKGSVKNLAAQSCVTYHSWEPENEAIFFGTQQKTDLMVVSFLVVGVGLLFACHATNWTSSSHGHPSWARPMP